MTACAGGHSHDHDHDHDHDHSAEAIAGHEHEHEGEHNHENESQPDHEHEGEHDHETEDDHDHDELPEHTVIVTKKQPFSFVVKAGGTILPDSKDVINVTSKASGIVRLTDHFLFPGMKVRKGTPLFIISGDELTIDNTEVAMLEAASDFERTKTQYDRAKRLIEDKLITMDHYLEARNEFEKAEIRYNNLRSGFSANGSVITAPEDGFINQVYITEGSKVSAGETLLSVIIEHNLVLRADVSPAHLARLGDISHASFRMVYSDKIYHTGDLNGRKISHARSTGGNNYYIPVFFNLEFVPEIIPGTYAEIYLTGSPDRECITVPNSAILEEFGRYYVFVEDEDHHFIKRFITRGMTNGIDTEVLSGLSENEVVVATGAFAIKMSQMTTSIPHSHSH
jgi:RND family efflux transporter MFP subunit